MDIPQRGNLKEIGFSDLLAYLQRTKATGTVVVNGATYTKRVYIKEGRVIFASSNLDDESLGEMLIKAGMITKREYDLSVEILKKTGKKQGAILVELGVLTPKQLFEGLKFQVKGIIYSLFSLKDANFEFREGELPKEEIISLRLDIDELLSEAANCINKGEIVLNEEERKLKEKAKEFYLRLKDMTFADILQITEESSLEEIKRNYYRLAREFHPDRAFNSKDKELKEMLTHIFDVVTKAYNELKDDKKRSEFFRRIIGPKKKEERTDLSELFRRGIEEFKKGNYWGATDIFRWITRLDPRSAKAWDLLSRSLSNIPRRLKDAESAALEAIKLDPFNADYYARLGHIYLKAGLRKRAKRQFDKALNIDSANDEAIKGLKQISTFNDKDLI